MGKKKTPRDKDKNKDKNKNFENCTINFGTIITNGKELPKGIIGLGGRK